MNDPIVIEGLRSVLAPVVLGIALIVFLWKPLKRNAGPPAGWIPAVGLVAAFIAGHLATNGWWIGLPETWSFTWDDVWPVDTTRRLPHVATIALLAGLLTGRGVARPKPEAGVWLIASLVMAWILTEHRRRNGVWEGAEVVVWTVAWSLVVWICAMSFGAHADRLKPKWSLLSASALCMGASLVILGAGIASLSLPMGLLMGYAGGMFLLVLVRPGLTWARVAARVFGVLYAALLTLAYTNAPDPAPRLALGLGVLAPMILLLDPNIGMLARFRLPLLRLIQIMVALLIIAGAAVLALMPGAQDDDSYSDLYGLSEAPKAEVWSRPLG